MPALTPPCLLANPTPPHSPTLQMGHATAEAVVRAGLTLVPYSLTGESEAVAVGNVGVSGEPGRVRSPPAWQGRLGALAPRHSLQPRCTFAASGCEPRPLCFTCSLHLAATVAHSPIYSSSPAGIPVELVGPEKRQEAIEKIKKCALLCCILSLTHYGSWGAWHARALVARPPRWSGLRHRCPPPALLPSCSPARHAASTRTWCWLTTRCPPCSTAMPSSTVSRCAAAAGAAAAWPSVGCRGDVRPALAGQRWLHTGASRRSAVPTFAMCLLCRRRQQAAVCDGHHRRRPRQAPGRRECCRQSPLVAALLGDGPPAAP